ncbi:MAG: hypothetical protein KDI03_23955, partial [Anaerolineae bacterium]|nr:hypothetical protein [Anaerolineae bacterium]
VEGGYFLPRMNADAQGFFCHKFTRMYANNGIRMLSASRYREFGHNPEKATLGLTQHAFRCVKPRVGVPPQGLEPRTY